VYGAGANPVGLQVKLPHSRSIEPFLDSLGGFLYFTDRVLSPEASQFNFTIDLGVGLLIRMAETKGLKFGYRYHHLSNANISAHNPGVDSQIVYVGFSFLK
jgi:hypothetical protein